MLVSFHTSTAVCHACCLQALSGDYMSRVAWLAGIPLDRFMMDNVEQVKDLDASLEGVRLLVCSPKAGETPSMTLQHRRRIHLGSVTFTLAKKVAVPISDQMVLPGSCSVLQLPICTSVPACHAVSCQ